METGEFAEPRGRRRRLRREPGGRPHAFLLRMSDQEKARLESLADSAELTVQRYVMEVLRDGNPVTETELRARWGEIRDLRFALEKLSGQLAEAVEAMSELGQVPDDLPPLMEKAAQALELLGAGLTVLSRGTEQ